MSKLFTNMHNTMLQNLHKTVFVVALAALMSTRVSAIETSVGEEMEVLALQRETLAGSGLRGFFEAAQSNQWAAPKIYSQCWVDWLPEDQREIRKLEQGRRDFGLEIVKAVELESKHVLEPADSSERAAQVDRLLALSRWVGSPGGYGNFAIKRRVENLACIPIGHLVADLDYPVDKIEALLKRIAGDGEWLAMQNAILNEESPHKYDAKTKDELAKQWHRHFRKAWFAYKEKKGRYPHSFADGNGFPKEIAFYCEDETLPRPYTLATRWNKKLHHMFCVMGYEDKITTRIQNFLLFRKVIGRFPEKPSRPLEMFDSRIQEGFYEAWKPHEKEHGIHPGASGYTYESILNNRFMDYDTAEFIGFLGAKNISKDPSEAKPTAP